MNGIECTLQGLRAFTEIRMAAMYIVHVTIHCVTSFYSDHLWASLGHAQVSSLERCPYFRGNLVHISM